MLGGIVESITPWNDESGLGSLATGAITAGAAYYTAGALGAGFWGSMAAAGTVGYNTYSQQRAKARRKEQAAKMREQAAQRMENQRKEERRRRAAIRREMLAERAISGNIQSNPTDTAFEKREYENKVPSLSNTLNMSEG